MVDIVSSASYALKGHNHLRITKYDFTIDVFIYTRRNTSDTMWSNDNEEVEDEEDNILLDDEEVEDDYGILLQLRRSPRKWRLQWFRDRWICLNSWFWLLIIFLSFSDLFDSWYLNFIFTNSDMKYKNWRVFNYVIC